MAENKILYTTIKNEAVAEFEEKRSIFIGHAKPVKCEEEAAEFIKAKKKEFADATHNVSGYIIKNGIIARYSDDGEPQGTAGIPILDIIRKKEITDVCVVVVRYFGGILLGTGGLVHAYSHAAIEAISEAHVIEYSIFATVRLTVNYSDYQRLSALMSANDFSVTDTEYTDFVVIHGTISADKLDSFTKCISETTSGRCKLEVVEKKFGFRE